MARPWIRRISSDASVVVATLALLWAVLWLGFLLLQRQLDIRTIIAIAIVALALLAAIWWLWWWLPKRQVARPSRTIRDPKARADTEDNFGKTVGTALGGAAALIGAVVAYLQFTQQQQASHDLLISNQVSKGFEQLAGKEMAMRLGGIYGLEGVMNTSDQCYQPVVEALCSFVRESTTRRQVTLTTLLEALFAPPRWHRGERQYKPTPATDVQAALTVIGRRKEELRLGYLNLAGAKIPGADLNRANLFNANLNDVILSGANLHGANLLDAT
jgi:uncharacterized protein YjbI with pentapeptide repeats